MYEDSLREAKELLSARQINWISPITKALEQESQLLLLKWAVAILAKRSQRLQSPIHTMEMQWLYELLQLQKYGFGHGSAMQRSSEIWYFSEKKGRNLSREVANLYAALGFLWDGDERFRIAINLTITVLPNIYNSDQHEDILDIFETRVTDQHLSIGRRLMKLL